MRPVQRITNEYLVTCREMAAEQIIQLLEDFRRLHSGTDITPTKRG